MDDSKRQQQLIELCCLIVERHKVEQAWNRAQWKLSYYRKVKTKHDNSLSNQEQVFLDKKKIEKAQLWALQRQKELVEIQKRLNKPILIAKSDLFASFLYDNDGRVNGIWLPDIENRSDDGIELNMKKIVEMVDQYEADTILTTALEDNTEL